MIMSPHSVIFLFQPQSLGRQTDPAITQLQANGLPVISCSDLRELYSQVQSCLAPGHACAVVVLGGRSVDNNMSRKGRRTSVSPATAMTSQVLPSLGCWAMLEHGWVLAGPQQQRIALTTGERAFLTTLFAQPGLRASHKQLIDAVNSSYTQDVASSQRVRLVLLVSRLRRKLREHGAEAPLKSLHRWGYMFAGQVL